MNYWGNLTQLENSIYEVRKVQASLRMLTETTEMQSADSSIPEYYQTYLYDLEERMTSITDELNEQFQSLWSAVREDSFQEDADASNRWRKIVSSMIPNEVKVRESAANAYPPQTQQDLFDEAWREVERMQKLKEQM